MSALSPELSSFLFFRMTALLLLQRQLAVAAGGDGTLRVLDVLRSEPLLLLEPAAGALMATAWSPSRPLVFAAASGVLGGCRSNGRLALEVRGLNTNMNMNMGGRHAWAVHGNCRVAITAPGVCSCLRCVPGGHSVLVCPVCGTCQ
jgi:hypothetical protein